MHLKMTSPLASDLNSGSCLGFKRRKKMRRRRKTERRKKRKAERKRRKKAPLPATASQGKSPVPP